MAACFSLQGSAVCSSFNQFSVSSQIYPNIVNDVQSLDNFIQTQANNQLNIPDFQNRFDCQGYDGSTQRFHISVLCGMFVDQSSQPQAGCNQQLGTSKGELCKGSANAYLTSIRDTFANQAYCSQSPSQQALAQRNDLIQQTSTFISHLQADNGKDCVIAEASSPEAAFCGYNDINQALALCAKDYPNNACCAYVQGATPPPAMSSTGSAPASMGSSSSMINTNSTSGGSVSSTSATVKIPSSTSSSTATTTPATTNTIASVAPATPAGDTILGLQTPVFIGALVGGVVLLFAIITGISIGCSRRRKAAAAALEEEEYLSPAPKGGATTPAGARGGADFASLDAAGNVSVGAGQSGGSAAGRTTPGMPITSGDPMMMAGAGAAIGAGAVAAGGGGMMMMTSSNASEANNNQNNNNQIAETMEAVFNYVPNLSDEIYLYVGDPVIVQCSFDDGWAYGFNMTTKMEGTFPLACVAPYVKGGEGRGDSWIDGFGRNITRDSFSISQRQSSIYGPTFNGGSGNSGDGFATGANNISGSTNFNNTAAVGRMSNFTLASEMTGM